MLVPHGNFDSVAPPDHPINVVILGSTGSIGRSALEVIRSQPGRFNVLALAAGGSNLKLLADQVREFQPKFVGLATTQAGSEFTKMGLSAELCVGRDELSSLAALNQADIVLAAIVGIAGLSGVATALRAGKKVALANKESLVCAGEIIKKLLEPGNGSIIPVDSEHSAIFQALQGEAHNPIRQLLLTASGGPFRTTPLAELKDITPKQALQHPRWQMGAKITIDSATMVNKALELIEAFWLFGVEPDKIEVLIHPQSIVHSLVHFEDGTQMAQLSRPDMKGPIAYGLNYPYGRLKDVMAPLDLRQTGSLDFFELDQQRFPAVGLARKCLSAGGAMSAVFNIANEVAVDFFLREQIGFLDIMRTIEKALDDFTGSAGETLEDIAALDERVRRKMTEWIGTNLI